MGSLRDFLIDVGRNAYGLGENVASLGSAAIAEPVAGYAAMFDPVNGAQAIREGMTYQPRTEAGRMYQQGAAQAVGRAVKPVMPVIDTWQKGVDIAGRYSPTLGALMQTAPTALGVALGAKSTLQAGRQASNTLGAMQARMIANANAPRTLNTGFMGQRGSVGTQRPLTEFEQAHLIAQQNAALPVSKGGLGLAPDNTAMDRARAMGFDVDNPVYHGTNADIDAFRNDLLGTNTGASSAKKGHFFAEKPFTSSQYAYTASKLNVDDLNVIENLANDLIRKYNSLRTLEDSDFKMPYLNDLEKGKEELALKIQSIRDNKGGGWLSREDNKKIDRINSILNQWDYLYTEIMTKKRNYLMDKYGDDWREITPKEGANVLPVFLNRGDIHEYDFNNSTYREKKYTDVLSDAITTNKDSVLLRNTFDPGGIGTQGYENISVIFDPKNIRSRFAAFDPMKKESSNLLATSAAIAPTATMAAYLYNQERNKGGKQ